MKADGIRMTVCLLHMLRDAIG